MIGHQQNGGMNSPRYGGLELAPMVTIPRVGVQPPPELRIFNNKRIEVVQSRVSGE